MLVAQAQAGGAPKAPEPRIVPPGRGIVYECNLCRWSSTNCTHTPACTAGCRTGGVGPPHRYRYSGSLMAVAVLVDRCRTRLLAGGR
jgi:hypothetical protein